MGAAGATTAPSSVEELEARIEAILKRTGTPGMIGAIAFGDEVVWQGALGVADLETRKPVTRETIFRLGSGSKILVSLATMKLVERGKLRLSDPVSKLAPEAGIVNRWEATHPVRLVHLLQHTAGLDDIRMRGYAVDDPNITTGGGVDFNTGSRRVRWHPGTRMAYSNIGPPIAALAVENVSGERFEDFVDREVFDVLGMRTATYFYDEAVASSYDSDGSRQPYRNIGLRPSGAVNVSSADMIQLLRMFNNRGTLDGRTLIRPESLDRMETPTSTLAAQSGLRVGSGLGISSTQEKGFVYWGHRGRIDGFASKYAYLPGHGRGYFISINRGSSWILSLIENEVTAFITKDLVPPEPPAPVEQAEDQLRALEGLYQPDAPRQELTAWLHRLMVSKVRYGDGSLHIGLPMDDGETVRPVGGNLFIRDGDPLPSLAFVTSPDGEQLLQGEDQTLRRVSPLVAYGRPLAVLSAALLVMSTLLFAPVWLVRKLSGRLRGVRYLSVRVLPLVGALTLLASAFLLIYSGGTLGVLARPSVRSVGFWLGSLSFAALAGVSLINTALRFRQRGEVGRAIWYHSLLASVALVVLAIFLASNGWIGLRTWAY